MFLGVERLVIAPVECTFPTPEGCVSVLVVCFGAVKRFVMRKMVVILRDGCVSCIV